MTRYHGRNQTLLKSGHEVQDLFETQPQDTKIALVIVQRTFPTAKVIWDPCAGNGAITDVFDQNQFETLRTDKFIVSGTQKKFDIFDTQQQYPTDKYDVMVTNPPFHSKKKFLTRCFETKKPFVIMYPIETIAYASCAGLFKKHGVTIIIPVPPPQFDHDGKVYSNNMYICF